MGSAKKLQTQSREVKMWGEYDNCLAIGGYVKGELNGHTDLEYITNLDNITNPDNITNLDNLACWDGIGDLCQNLDRKEGKYDMLIAVLALAAALSPIIFTVFYVLCSSF
ncbi:MAG: hypothetical protein LBL39_01405 [Planctomycetaceae bacterium]|jgi:hypothetical protein|nr:hypothetical protein [Planctomycetaceae bacterium]